MYYITIDFLMSAEVGNCGGMLRNASNTEAGKVGYECAHGVLNERII